MDKDLKVKIEVVQNKWSAILVSDALNIGAIKLSIKEPFTWASGYRMPIYNDNRKFLQSAKSRRDIAQAFAELLEVVGFAPEGIAGTATAGIPHATTLGDLLSLPLSYVRQTNKSHGLCNMIEGLPKEDSYMGKKILVIEDLISTGSSSINACLAVREKDGIAPYCFAIFSYGLDKASEAFSNMSPPCLAIPIITYDFMIGEALKVGYIKEEEAISLKKWRASPFTWWDECQKGNR